MSKITSILERIKSKPKNLKIAIVGIFTVMFAFGIYNATYYNFITEVIKISPVDLGRLEAVRELPGLLLVLFSFVTVYFADRTTGSLCAVVAAIGFTAYTNLTTVNSLLLWTFVWSVSMHIWFPLQQSLIVSFAPNGRGGSYLGFSASITAIANLCGMLLVAIIGKGLTFKLWYTTVVLLMVVGAVLLMFIPKTVGESNRPKISFKKKYLPYYILIFLEGCRKQVFLTFAVYVLTREFSTPLKVVATLMMINNIVNMFGYPIVGRLADKLGEKVILRFCYSLLIFVYIGYAYSKNVHVLFLMYILDNLFYLSSVCLSSYVKRICGDNDLLTTLSTGQSFNHLAA
ncbi:MAG: MFS transporter, partial [Armatimonadetes bacterium]|nr:MFS transporter [Candidatus Hippobium faecium]